MQALYPAEVDQVSGGISDSEAREAVFQTRLEGMIQDRANGRQFVHHDLALLVVGVVAGPALFFSLSMLYSATKVMINAVRNMEFISCDDKGTCCCPAGG